MFRTTLIFVAATLLTPFVKLTAAEASKPNFVNILCDDLGYGDVEWQGKSELGPYGDFVMETDLPDGPHGYVRRDHRREAEQRRRD